MTVFIHTTVFKTVMCQKMFNSREYISYNSGNYRGRIKDANSIPMNEKFCHLVILTHCLNGSKQ